MGFFSFFSKEKKETLDKGLSKTKESVFGKIARVVAGKSKVDDEVLDNLEEVLITSDVGVETTLRIIERIEKRVAAEKYMNTQELNHILRDEIAALLTENNTADVDDFEAPITQKPYVIMVVGVNGVGKTTTTINLAAALAVMEKKTLVVDCDPQANSTSGLGLAQESISGDLYRCFYDPESTPTSIAKTRSPYLDIIPASTNLVAVELELVDKMAREFFLSECLKHVEGMYDYIILDCPPSLGLITLNAFCASRELLIPLQCEFFALEGIVKLLQTYEQVRKRLNPNLSLLGVVLTMFDIRNRLTRDVKSEVQRCFPDHLFSTVIPRNVRLSEAPSHGKSIIHYDIKSKGAEAYISLAQEVVQRRPTQKTSALQ